MMVGTIMVTRRTRRVRQPPSLVWKELRIVGNLKLNLLPMMSRVLTLSIV